MHQPLFVSARERALRAVAPTPKSEPVLGDACLASHRSSQSAPRGAIHLAGGTVLRKVFAALLVVALVPALPAQTGSSGPRGSAFEARFEKGEIERLAAEIKLTLREGNEAAGADALVVTKAIRGNEKGAASLLDARQLQLAALLLQAQGDARRAWAVGDALANRCALFRRAARLEAAELERWAMLEADVCQSLLRDPKRELAPLQEVGEGKDPRSEAFVDRLNRAAERAAAADQREADLHSFKERTGAGKGLGSGNASGSN
jgi:hypothetical protein